MTALSIFKKSKKEKTGVADVAIKKAEEKKEGGRKGRIFLGIKRPLLSEKATRLSKERKYCFITDVHANKKMIKEDIETRYGVRVESVTTILYAGKRKGWGRVSGRRPNFKKAMVTLREGHTIDTSV